jgi:hypothetical protein
VPASDLDDSACAGCKRADPEQKRLFVLLQPAFGLSCVDPTSQRFKCWMALRSADELAERRGIDRWRAGRFSALPELAVGSAHLVVGLA